ncbi:RHS repeat-associated core domain-containing protein [Stenotrophomonas sp. C3(2023)]|uniref:RHS repeat-associated core domain-containing protein n=1 Tax=Stenotrophomonas sp. C3(2023) TaxID=3080277 RepID=UPI00293C444C|nr:RHS repeat-associated core domain-containing protein [Stenotrophomonas sp. C3(2023)]MDV3468423.1 RHS repeat-associated core domain-containing protein [Stenotrophomonas sp. C3(2023)]
MTPDAVFAEEIGPRWIVENSGRSYSSERAAQSAIIGEFEKGGGALAWGLSQQKSIKDGTRYYYTPQPMAASYSEWGFYGKSEAELVEEMRRKNASDAGCPAASVEYKWPPDEHATSKWTSARITRYSSPPRCVAHRVQEQLYVTRERYCPKQRYVWNDQQRACVLHASVWLGQFTYIGERLTSGCTVGNPCNPANGDKHQTETDLALSWLAFRRDYHSANSTANSALGPGWTHQHNLRLSFDWKTPATLTAADGSQRGISKRGDLFVLDDESGEVLHREGDDVLLLRADDVLRFNREGLLTERRHRNGSVLAYRYNASQQLVSITDSSARSLEVTYGAGSERNLITALSVDGNVLVRYGYTEGLLATVTYADGSTRRYHYENPDFPTHLTGITAEDGQRFSWYGYDAKGRVTCSQHSPGCADLALGTAGVRLEYPADGSSIVTDALGNRTVFGWTGGRTGVPRQLSSIIDDAGTQSRQYEAQGQRRLRSAVDRNGVRTRYDYAQSSTQRSTTITQADDTAHQRVTTLTYDLASNRLAHVVRAGRRTKHLYNAALQPTRTETRDSNGVLLRASQMDYCEAASADCGYAGQLHQYTDPNGNITRWTYYGKDDAGCSPDGDGNRGRCNYRMGDLHQSINALGQVTTNEAYDALGRVQRQRDANGVLTEFTYHPRGWLASVTVRGASAEQDRTTTLDWTPFGKLRRVTRPEGGSVTWLYNSAQQLTDVVDGAGNSISYTLDKQGNRIGESFFDPQDQLRYALGRTFNTLGLMDSSADAAGNITRYAYDPQGNLEEIADPLGRVTRTHYDALDRPDHITADATGLSAIVAMDHTADDALRSFTDPKRLVTRYAHDALGQASGLQSPDSGNAALKRDANGNVTERTDARGVTTTYRYDALDRLTSSSGPDPALDVAYRYDVANSGCPTEERFAVGRLSEVIHARGSTVYCHDRFGQVTRKIQTVDGHSLQLHYAYNKDGQRIAVELPDGSRAEYQRATQGEISGITLQRPGAQRQTLVQQVEYALFGPVTGWTYGNGRRLRRPLDASYRVQGVVDARPGGLALGYTYDAAGQLQTLHEGPAGRVLASYQYDGLGRLTQASNGKGEPLQQYRWDGTGNRISSANDDGTLAYHYPATSHRLQSAGQDERSYDANGNTLSMGSHRMTYNAANRMEAVYQGDTLQERYSYNHVGERILREPTDGAPVQTLYDEQGHWVGDYAADGSPIKQAIWLDDYPVALLGPQTQAASLAYVEPDHLGTPRVVIDSERDVAIWRWPLERDAFGAHAPEEDPDGDGVAYVLNLRFPGQQYTQATGLYYNYQRDLDATTGRYVQSDPIGLAGGISTYGYVGGNPLATMDPEGLEGIGPWSFPPGPARDNYMKSLQGPRGPDFIEASASLYFFQLSFAMSRSGRVFYSKGLARGYPNPVRGFGISLDAGYLLNSCADVDDMRAASDRFLTGLGYSVSAGYGLSLGGAYSPGNGGAVKLGLGMGVQASPGSFAEATEWSVPGW